MVGLAQGSDHLALHELPTAVAPCPIHPLVVQGAQIVPVLYEEAALGQVAAAHCRKTSSQLVIACQISGQRFPSARCWWLPVLSAVLGEGRGLSQRAIYYQALLFLLPLPQELYLIQVKSTGWVSVASVVCLRFSASQSLMERYAAFGLSWMPIKASLAMPLGKVPTACPHSYLI